MTRGNRHNTAGNIWHRVHRRHKKEFLLKFKRDRDLLKHWLFEAKKRFGLNVLNYTITSNHIHLLVEGNSQQSIANSMQLVAGRTAQEFNRRKNKKELPGKIVITELRSILINTKRLFELFSLTSE